MNKTILINSILLKNNIKKNSNSVSTINLQIFIAQHSVAYLNHEYIDYCNDCSKHFNGEKL